MAKVKAPTMGDVVKYELNHNFNREIVTLLTGTDYQIGSVLGLITASGKYKMSTNTGSDGAQTAAGVLIEAVDASDGDRTGVILKRGPALVARQQLVFDASVDDATKTATKIGQLVALGIVARDAA